MHLRILV
ncbi:hypothetical protein S40285_10890, partial [Stachybotrys chlorohalonatus IBT 40285]